MVTVPEIAQTLDIPNEKVHDLLDAFAPWVPYGGGGEVPRRYPAWVAAMVEEIEEMLSEGKSGAEVGAWVQEKFGRKNLAQAPKAKHIEQVMW